jgi:2'-5' RNA ligase
MAQIRAFIAIELPSAIKVTLKNLETRLKQPALDPVKWVEPDNIHLTLKFLGNIMTSQVPTVTSAMKSASQTISPFELQIANLGVFPNIKRVQVIWVGLKGEIETLATLQKYVDSELQKLGHSPDIRTFSPHLTLGRVRDTAHSSKKEALGRLITATKIDSAPVFTVRCLNLMQSRLSASAPQYTCLESIEIPALP